MPKTLSAVYKIQSESRVADLEHSVSRVKNQPDAEIEVVVLTDSNDVFELLCLNDDIDHLQTTRRSELTAARNIGAKSATGDAVAFVDDDAYPGNGWSEAVYRGLDEASAVGGPLFPDWRVPEPAWLSKSFHWLIGCGPYYDESKLVANTYGSNLVVDRDAFLDVGGFDESIGMGSSSIQQGGETHLCRKLRDAGYRAVWYEPDARMYHLIEAGNIRRSGLLRRAYSQGVAKAHLGFDDRESSYLREEWSLGNTATQAATALAFTGAVGAGFVKGRVVG